MATQRIIVTGGTGKAGQWIVKHLIERGYDVVNVDTRQPGQPQCRGLTADLTDLGQTIDAFSPHSTGDRRPSISNRRARQVLGWKQEFFLR